jgi:hypothetical protein
MKNDAESVRNPAGAGLLAVVAAAAIFAVLPDAATAQSAKDFAPGQLKESSFDPTYNVCRGTDPKCYNDWGVQGRKQNRVLIYSRTAGPRHAKLGPALPAGLNPELDPTRHVAQSRLVEMLAAEGIQADWTEDVARMTSLGNYKAVIFLSTTRDTLWDHAKGAAGGTHLDAARTSVRQFIRAGNGFVGIHNAFGTEYNWQYYEGLLGNANYYNHGANQNGTFVIVADDSSTSGVGLPVGSRVDFKDEWYNLIPFPTNVKFLVTVDTSTLAQGPGSSHPGHPNFHPVSWCQYYDGGRAWVTTLGHDRGAFEANSGFPGAAEFQRHIIAGIKSVMGLVPFCS